MRVAWFGVLIVLSFSEVFMNLNMDEVVECIPVSVFSKAAAPERTEMQWYRIRSAIARINSYMQEHVSGMQVVQLFNREQRAYDDFAAIKGKLTLRAVA